MKNRDTIHDDDADDDDNDEEDDDEQRIGGSQRWRSLWLGHWCTDVLGAARLYCFISCNLYTPIRSVFFRLIFFPWVCVIMNAK